ncbi:LOW QUALITY PROTEIN: uncharacterized protein EMH_0072250 [Eimeria mitis]|uniref:TNase-like domain-containing protein n=1 Tax=Eimeria mitis TaxID=44415 RepID=U6KJ00_9EIME|nr:LOW QUALITY PROTEIN: uncharacterized protein EMH_0072250 [Eimeria mitis]CDJ36257.1 hypothetical protein, conserved [Eimeria mitis]
MAVVSVADVMMQRGLAWLDSVGGEKGIQKPQGGRWGNCRYQHLMALQERARKARQGVWQLRRDVLKDLRLDEEGNLPRFSGEESAFPALLLAQMLQYLSGDNGDGKSTAKEENGGRFFAALVTRVVDGDTVRLAPVLSDEHVHRLMHENERRSISELESWGDGEKSVAVKDADKRFILTTVYAIDTPEVARGGLKPYTGRAVLSVGAHLTYGSEQLDEGGQPLGVAAGRAMSELVLGRVVLVEELGSDCFERLVARIFIPAVSDSLHTGAASHAAFFSLLSTELRCLYIRDFGSVADLPQCTGVRGVVSIVHRIRKARSGNLQQLLLGCMRRMVYNHIRGLIDASEEMLRRGLARVYCAASVKVKYGGKEQKKRLEELARTAENRGCGMWGLPWWCQEDPKEHRRRTRGDGRFTCNEGKLERRKTCNNILINSCIGGNGNR